MAVWGEMVVQYLCHAGTTIVHLAPFVNSLAIILDVVSQIERDLSLVSSCPSAGYRTILPFYPSSREKLKEAKVHRAERSQKNEKYP
jgi:hypothetical protein